MLFLSRPELKSRLFFLVFLFVLATSCVQAAETTEKIDINTASLEGLEKITGVGPVIAQRIIEARPFSSVDDLIRVNGIGEKTLQKIKEQGLTWVSGELQTEPIAEGQPQKIQENYASGLIITEILPSPEGQDEKEEWIEIFNQNDFEVDLSFWQIADTMGQTKTYTFPSKTIIKVKGFLVLDRPTTKITLNNSEDGLLLIQPNGNIIDNIDYQKAINGQSYSRMENNWVWSTVLTPGQNNAVSLPVSQPENQEEESKAQQLATISQSTPKTHFSVFFIALGFAVLSGIIIILTKKKLI
ncbi:MAG: hypothetical protein A2Z68_02535 [Candidatus Nealsonbacteria bacterium RBG_13_38_11]|uniref:LTD domain-containing protein n=1 Tax=Candidatus Nealsonbacteria bacterium RBG_13_38_11 TaxID=1801662 RepID=A0A1G2DZB1_9BACT|nr:MAG: hypothetical protein A2Z68_02535 [Candidatus Nealsonbacteria bacterium RBG_13_38_11]